ncbi:adhesion G protein-coupled receptor L2-like [Patiria miniata]|uniref:Adhesion G-protein coupled receptor D1-like n=1 Tax=Patiria miniata TaxID=46514 RepID=A0A914ARR1_PATMI|nr:adhesion G protein-coupled receptor L2-like [Patiria miniata]
MTKYRPFVGFLWLAVCALTCDARTYNESELDELYLNGTHLYWDAKYHWGMSDGYNEMLGTAGMKVCFVEGPEREALVLGEESNFSSDVTLELQHSEDSVSLYSDAFTVALWYSFRPVDFFAEINDSMACHLLQLGGSQKNIAISYDGLKEYNLQYSYQHNTNTKYVINDDADRPHWEFEVNDTINGGVIKRGWQWNHIAMVYDGSVLTAYYNGFSINKTMETVSSGMETLPYKLSLNVPKNGKTACSPVGFDEVAFWPKALKPDDILALRVHVGRNRSLDEPEPTTEVPTTTLPDTTAGDTTAGDTTAGDTTAGDTTMRDSTAGDSTAMDTTVGDSTFEDTTLGETSPGLDGDSTILSTTVTDSTPEQSTSEMLSTDAPTDKQSTDGGMAPRSTGEPDGRTTTSVPVATTQSAKAVEVDELAKSVENITTAPSQEVTAILVKAGDIVGNATEAETYYIADNVVDLLKITSKVPPAKVNSSSEEIAKLNDYRKAFVNLFSTVLVRWEESVKPVSINAEDVVQVMDNFLTNYVEDPTVAENESIFSNGIDVQLAPVDGTVVQMDDLTNVSIPTDAFDFETRGVRVLICLLKRGLQNVLEPQEGVQPIDTGLKYSKNPTWNITGPIVVMRVSGRSGSVQLKKPVSFEMHVDPSLGEDPICVYQKGANWSGEGVERGKYDKDCPCVICMTYHMTNFAVLMAVDGVPLEGPHALLLSIISYIGCGLSLLCLVIAIILFIVLRELNSTRMGIVKNLCVALFLAQLLFVAGIETAKVNEYACKAVAALLHYFFLCVMAWMLCNGLYLYQKVKRATRPGSVVDLIYFCILGWGAPAVVVAITAGINHNVYGTKELCWLSVEGSGIWAFVAPAMLIIIFNAFVTFLTMKAFVSVKVFKDKNDKDKFKSGLRAVVVMLPILGLSWIFGLLAFGDSGIFFQYLFAIFNSLQGVFLFIFHILLNDEVKGAMRRRFGKVGASGDENMLFNKIWAFSSTTEKTEMSSVTQHDKKLTKPVYKN